MLFVTTLLMQLTLIIIIIIGLRNLTFVCNETFVNRLSKAATIYERQMKMMNQLSHFATRFWTLHAFFIHQLFIHIH